MKNKYKYTSSEENYEDFSSGRVLYGVQGATNFPVRLGSEIFQQCAAYLKSKGKQGPYHLYDPFCGVAYSLTTLGFLHGKELASLTASDADRKVLEFAGKNLSLLTPEGLNRRIEELKTFVEKYNKDSHREALKSAYRLRERTLSRVPVHCFQFNAVGEGELSESIPKMDIVITDLPYGKLAQWDAASGDETAVQIFLDKIKSKLSPLSVVAIVCEKKQRFSYQGYKNVATWVLGKRRILFIERDSF